MVKLWSKGQLIACLGKSLFNHLWCIRTTTIQTAAQFLYRRRLHEDAQGTLTIEFLDIDATLDIYVENDGFASIQLVFHLRFQRAVEAVLIDLLVFQKLLISNLSLEFLRSEEEIFHTILFCTTRGAGGATDREGQLQFRVFLHQPVDYCALSAAGRSAEN